MGDGLYLPMGVGNAIRIQGAYVSDEEIAEVVAFAKTQAEPEYAENVTVAKADPSKHVDPDIGGDLDELIEAINLVVTSRLGVDLDAATQTPRRFRQGGTADGPDGDQGDRSDLPKVPKPVKCWSGLDELDCDPADPDRRQRRGARDISSRRLRPPLTSPADRG